MNADPLLLDYRRRHRPPRAIWGAVVLALGVAAFAAAAAHGLRVAAELSEARGQIEESRFLSRRRAAALRGKSGDPGDIGREVAAANAISRQLNLPWTELFNAVEASKSENVALLSIAPDAQQRLLRIAGEAKSLADVLDYLKRLGAVAMFESAYLLDHEIAPQDPHGAVRFTVTASWRGAR